MNASFELSPSAQARHLAQGDDLLDAQDFRPDPQDELTPRWEEHSPAGADARCAARTDAVAGDEPRVASTGACPLDDVTLAGWIERVADHDEAALSALYDATLSRVFGLVMRIVRQQACAEEVVEDTYFQVWRQAARFDPGRGRALAWLLAMARSRAIDALRREQRFDHEPLCSDGAAADAGAHALDDLLEGARDNAALHRALSDLKNPSRQLVAMAFLRGLSHEEIALQTEMPLGTVKSQIRRALVSLRALVAEARLGSQPT
jgi:RNA polymerase sigma-70 factor, ECF subfamily